MPSPCKMMYFTEFSLRSMFQIAGSKLNLEPGTDECPRLSPDRKPDGVYYDIISIADGIQSLAHLTQRRSFQGHHKRQDFLRFFLEKRALDQPVKLILDVP